MKEEAGGHTAEADGGSVGRWFGLAPGSMLPAPCSRSGVSVFGGTSFALLPFVGACGLDSGWEDGNITL
jgi:hypothetical protein